jgi:uncharacterized membrane protein HdeD (DUF308 family)
MLLAVGGRQHAGPGALLAFGLASIVAGLISLLAISAHGEEDSWLVPEGSRGPKLALSALFVIAGVVMAVAGVVRLIA